MFDQDKLNLKNKIQIDVIFTGKSPEIKLTLFFSILKGLPKGSP